MAFWSALSALAPLPAAISNAQALNTAQKQEQEQFDQEAALRDAQITAQKLAGQAEQQKLNAPLFLPNSKPFVDAHGKLVRAALVNGALQTVPVPGLTPDQEYALREKQARKEAQDYGNALTSLGLPRDQKAEGDIYLQAMGFKPVSTLPRVISTPQGDYTLGQDQNGNPVGIPLAAPGGSPIGGQGVLSSAEANSLNALSNPGLKTAGLPLNQFTPGMTRQEANTLRTSINSAISDANAGKRMDLADKRLNVALQNSSDAPIAGNAALTGNAYLASLPPSERSLVEGLGTGKAGLEKLGYVLTRNPRVLKEVLQAYPDFDSSKVQGYISQYHNFTTGKAAEQLKAGANALQHLLQLKAINDADTVAQHNPATAAYKRYNQLLNVVTGEIAKFYGMPQTNENRKQLRDPLDSLFNRDAAITEQAQAMGVAFNDLLNQWNTAKPSSSYQAPLPGLNASALSAFANLSPSEYKKFVANGGINGNRGGSFVSAPTSGMVKVQIPGMPPGQIPAAALQQFQHDHPNAQVIQ